MSWAARIKATPSPWRMKAGLSRANCNGLRGLWIAGLRTAVCDCALSRLPTPSSPTLLGRFGIGANNGAECTPGEHRGP
eukprot:9635893-Alexandrium_andersonii.AAC.1